MLAIVIHRHGGPEVLSLEELPDPRPGPGQVLLRNYAAGVNPVDAYMRAGTYARLPPLPFTPGWDGAGVVQSIGPGVTQFSSGDRVYFSGTAAGRGVGAYAELVCCTYEQVHRLPERLSFSQGAAIGVPYATAHRALFGRAATRTGETVLVHGASGAVGIASVQLARAHGCMVIGTAGSESGLELVRTQGATQALRHGTDTLASEVSRITGGQGVNVIIEMLANVNLDRDLSMLALGGRIVIVGNRGRIEIDPRQIMSKESSVLGFMLWHTSDSDLAQLHRQLMPGLENGALDPVVGVELPLAQAGRAHELLFEGGTRGKLTLAISDSAISD